MKKILSILIFALLGIGSITAQEVPERPNPPRLVNDYAKILSVNEYNSLESALELFARETSTQILIVTMNEIDGSIDDFAFRVGEKWGVGQKKDNNGVVIVLKPKIGNSKGEVFVATGYGLEGVLPDAIVNGVVVDNEMIPSFKQNRYYEGLANGVNVIMDITRGEYTAEYYQENYAERKDGIIPGIFLFIIIIFVSQLLRGRRGRHYSAGSSLPFWLAMGMMSSGRSSHSGSFGNFSSGGGGFGGFGGFGGGSFGGGGAGGSW